MDDLKSLNEALRKGMDCPFYSAVIVVSPDRENILLAKRKDGKGWTMPAGGAEADESPEMTAIRETFEEANIFLFPDILEKLDAAPTKDGKVCHVYLAILEQMQEHGPQNDPDKEVRKWIWHPISKPLPEPMSEPRRKSYAKAVFELAKKKAEEAFLDAMERHELFQKSPEMPVGSISASGKYKKVGKDDWQKIGGAGAPKGEAPGMNKTPSQKPIHNVDVKFKHKGREYSHTFQVPAQSTDHAWGLVESKIKAMEAKIGPVELTGRSVQPLTVQKSLAQNEMTGTNIDTVSQATEDLATKNSYWLPIIKEFFSDMDLGSEPRAMHLDFPWELHANQIDKGIYDGYVKNRDIHSGNSGEVVFQIAKMTLPAMIEALKAKEFIKEPQAPEPPPTEKTDAHGIKELVDILKEAVNAPNTVNINFYKAEDLSDLNRTLIAHWMTDPDCQMETVEDLTPERMLELKKKYLIEKARPALPVGTRRNWGGQEYVKHSDGWVAVSGDHHGKMMGKFKEDPTHKEHADEHITKEPKSEEALPEPKAPAEEVPEESKESPKESPKTANTLEPQENSKDKETPEDKAAELNSSSESSPREEAEADLLEDTESGEYANARNSKFSNKGEDLVDSARHRALDWKGLLEAEKDGSADRMVRRDVLLKVEPLELAESLNKDNFLSALAISEAMKKFPAAPKSAWTKGWEEAPAETPRYGLIQDKSNGALKKVPLRLTEENPQSYVDARVPGGYEFKKMVSIGETRKELREEYLNAFQEIKAAAEKIAKESTDNDPITALQKLKEKASQKIGQLRDKDRFSDTANLLVPFVNTAANPSQRRKSTSAIVAVNQLLTQALGGHADKTAGMAKILEDGTLEKQVKRLLSGESKDKIFGKDAKNEPKKWSAADAYVKHAVRKGPDTGLDNAKDQEAFLLKKAGMRGLQWGNSVTDEERAHHLKEAANAFKDLTDVLGLPEEMGSFNGRLGLAIGARGKGRALAHYEPDLKVINLTRKGGVGSLAHEWFHFFDNINYEIHDLDASKSYATTAVGGTWAKDSVVSKSPTFKAIQDLQAAPVMQKFRDRVRKYLRENDSVAGLRGGDYWLSSEEMGARCFERCLSAKMSKMGRENTYLSGIIDENLWPNDAEAQEMVPLFDAIFAAFKDSGDLKKALNFMELLDLNVTLQGLL